LKINDFNPFLTGNTLPVEALNLRDGQRIIGKVISASADEALLEMAGHSFRAKIEGNPEVESGAVLKFLINHDEQGRVLLKIISNDQPTNDSDKSNPLSKQTIDQKAITTALSKAGIPVNQENIDNFIELLENFQSKYRQDIPPQVLAFIIAREWRVNPETIITSWLYQDHELRNLLWNLLHHSDSKQSKASLLARLMLEMSSKSEEVQGKLETLFKQIETIICYMNKNEDSSSMSLKEAQTFPKTELRRSANQNYNPGLFEKTASNQSPNLATKTSTFNASFVHQLKQLVLKLTSTFEPKELNEKLEVLLERNLALNKALLQENSNNANHNLIPFLVIDSQNVLHEVLVKWREEPGDNKQVKREQIIQMNIPTENLGEIHLYLRIGGNGSQITFKVENDSVRKYLLRNLIELKESVNRKDVLINVTLEPKENYSNPLSGVDLWI
jgi:hypothetical protein